ncbi:MAG TPA: Holliday junction branch migration protein RuvA [Candidatus Hydrogenedentes bacterium]|nr:Holliday junction branch migration protein RuvA [Candidatus Hydrogenedentota bacterium]
MFAFLLGSIAQKALTHVELDVNGVGYQVFVPDSTHRKLVPNQDATLLTHCYIREDAFQIYGFLREEERALFRTLLGVSGIGPKVALAILSAMSPAEFGRAVLENDVKAFTRVGGVGKKTGQRLILELKAKMGQDAELGALLGEPAFEDADIGRDDVIDALCALGCTMLEAKRAAAKAREKLGAEASDEELVKAALRSMAKV